MSLSNGLWCLLLPVVLVLIGTVSSSHFRGGIMMARPLPGGQQNQIEISYFISWRRSRMEHYCDRQTVDGGQLIMGEGSLACQYNCSGDNIAQMSYICTSFSVEEDWTFGERQVTVNFANRGARTVAIGFTGNAWIDPWGRWNISTTFSLAPRRDIGRINSTPRAIIAPVIRLAQGCNQTISLAVSDPDGDIVRCRWAQGAECMSVCRNDNLGGDIQLNTDSCTIDYFNSTYSGLFVVAIMVEDFTPGSSTPLSSASLQFIVRVVQNTAGSCSQMPAFVQPTIRHDSCVAIPPGATFTTQLVAISRGTGATIMEIETVPPLGTRVGELTQILDSNRYYVNVTWTPSSSQQNATHMFCFSAVGADAQTSGQNCIDLLPGYFPPAPLPATAVPNRQLVHPSNNTTWRVRFDMNIERSSVAANINFHEYISEERVYSIDASQSLEVAFEHSNGVSITPRFIFAEKTRYYITFDRHVVQGLEQCRPGNEPLLDKNFWRFETMDVTPPTITSLTNSTLSNGNISFSWESNENVTWTCMLEQGSVQSTVNCSGAYWTGYGLSEGSYLLRVRATDEAGNMATLTHAFQIDRTPPVTTFTHRPTSLSNERTPTLIFSCNESPCSYECSLTPNMTAGTFTSCDSGRFTTPVLEPNTNYTFHVRAMDRAGNQGEVVSYTWETDFEAPRIFGIQNTSVLCNDTLPEVTGEPQATDNRPETVTLIYNDTVIGCAISRRWTAADTAGNTAILVQNIDLEFLPTISLLPQVPLPCDSAAASLQVAIDTASAPNSCGLPLQLTHEDSPQRMCPGSFTRNWTVSSCGRSAAASQTVSLYDVCPPHACGRNESIARGTCSLGQCQCNQPWYGVNCDTVIYAPIAEPIGNSTLLEGQEYNITVALSQGSPPLTWSIVSGPTQLLLDQYTGQANWRRAQAGSHSIIVQIENMVGTIQVKWNLEVTPGYNARMSSVSSTIFPYAQPVTLTGYVEYFENYTIEEQARIVLVYIDIVTEGSTRTGQTYSNSSGNFSLTFYPLSTEYGTYTAGARHPNSSQSQPQVQWGILGMRSVPGRVTLNGEAVSTFEGIFQNATFIHNDGPGTLTGVTTTPLLPNTRDVSVEVTLRGNPSNGSLEPGEQLAMDIRITVSRPLRGSFLVTVETREGTSLDLIIGLQITPILPSLLANPASLNARVVRGRSRVFEFNATNFGRATANNVQPILPDTSFISLVSFGNMQGNNLQLRSGESALLSIRIRIPETQQLGDITARIVITSSEVSASLPISITVSSDSLMDLTVVVEDEYTYFASGRPLVSDAIVTLINYQRNLRLTQSTSSGNGSVQFTDIFEDRYEMFVEAPSHRTLRQIIVTSVQSPSVTVFIERQAVTYTWSVTPVTYQDSYVITLEADFQTNVPIPVVTVTPNEFNLEDLETGLLTSLQINVTNHGLIRADNVGIELPRHPSLEFSTSSELLGHLEPLSSVLVSIQSSRRPVQKRAAGTRSALYLINFVYGYVCGTPQMRNAPVVLRDTDSDDPDDLPNASLDFTPGSGSVGSGTGGGGGSIGGGIGFSSPGFGGGDGGSGAGGEFSFSGYSSVTPVFCNPCVSGILGCLAPSSIPELLGVPFSGCIPLIQSHTSPLSSVSDALSWLQCTAGNSVTGLALCAHNRNIYRTCLRSLTSRRRKRNTGRTLNGLLEALYPIQQSMALGTEVLGDDLWISVGDSHWLSNVFRPALDDDSDAGVLISPAELSAILAAAPPNGTTINMVSRMVERVNNTLHGWNSGQLEPLHVSNMASFSRVQEFAQNIDTYNTMAVDRGFSSYVDAYNFAAGEVNQIDNLEREDGVCAVVRIRIEQELAVTREAFLARLEIGNMEDSPLQQILVEIIATDLLTGGQATHLFSIGNGTLSGSLASSPGGGWSLPSSATGAVEWLIIPYSEAAPEADHVYNVGGSFSYILDGENITVPLLPAPITVRPDPSLLVHYFWERYVVGDDPFTDVVEPSVPFTLGVAVKNTGYGTAYSLQIASAQPEIIENERGLLVNFMIIGANIGSEIASPSLTVRFGDLLPNTTVVARWFMISSLQGEFMRYSATFENVNPLGDPKLSILDDLQIHELIRNVDMYTTEENDGVLDFLVNDRDDFLAYPDALYSSRTLDKYNVTAGVVLSVQANSEDMAVSLVVRTLTNTTGWVYYRYEGTRDILRDTALSINGTKREGNQTVVLPSQNSWITSGEDDMFYLHIVDYLETTEEVIFTLNLCIVDCPSTAVPFLQPPVKLPTPSVTIPIPPGDLYINTPLTLTCDVEFDPSLADLVNVTVTWQRENSSLSNDSDDLSITSSLLGSHFTTNLTLHSPSAADSTNFTCTAGILPSGLASVTASDLGQDTIEVILQLPTPSVTISIPPGDLYINTPLTLTCDVEFDPSLADFVNVTVTWQRESSSLSNDISIASSLLGSCFTSNLTLHSPSAADSTNFTCTAGILPSGLASVTASDLGQDTIEVILKVPTPSVTISIPPGDLYINTPLTLTCDVEFDPSLADFVNVTVTWQRESSPLSNDSDDISIVASLLGSYFTSNLTLHSPSAADSTNFTCTAGILPSGLASVTASDLGQDAVEVILQLPTPFVTISIPPGDLYINTPLTLTCDVEFDPSLADLVNVTVTWQRESSPLSNDSDDISIASSLLGSYFTSNLTLYSPSAADSTNFTCTAGILPSGLTSVTTSDLGQDTIEVILQVPTPSVAISIPPGNLYINTPLTLTCDVEFDPSLADLVNVTLSWLRKTSLLSDDSDDLSIASSLLGSHFTSNLTLYSPSAADSTNFTCTAGILPSGLTSVTASDLGQDTIEVILQAPYVPSTSNVAATGNPATVNPTTTTTGGPEGSNGPPTGTAVVISAGTLYSSEAPHVPTTSIPVPTTSISVPTVAGGSEAGTKNLVVIIAVAVIAAVLVIAILAASAIALAVRYRAKEFKPNQTRSYLHRKPVDTSWSEKNMYVTQSYL